MSDQSTFSDVPVPQGETAEEVEVVEQIEADEQVDEVEEVEVEAESVEFARVRAIAEAQGWTPKGKLNPVEFLENIPKYNEALLAKLRANEESVKRLQKAVGQQISAADAAAKAKAEQAFEAATERGDVAAARAAAAELHKPAPVIEDDPTDAQTKVKAWAEQPEQAWFRADQAMASKTAALYDGEMRALGRDDPDVILPLVEKQIRMLFPHKFTNPNRERGSAATTSPAARTTPTTRRAASAESLGIEPHILAQYRKHGLTDADIVKSMESTKRVY